MGEGERGREGEGERGRSLKTCNNPIKTRGLQHLTYTDPVEQNAKTDEFDRSMNIVPQQETF